MKTMNVGNVSSTFNFGVSESCSANPGIKKTITRTASICISLLVFSFSASQASAVDTASYNGEDNTLTFPVVSVDGQSFYYLKLNSTHSGTDTLFEVEEATEIAWSGVSDAYFSSDTGLLSVPNLNVGGDQWIMNLSLDQDTLQFRADAMLLPSLDTSGALTEVEYIDSSMERVTYQFDDDGNIRHIEIDGLELTFLNNERVEIWTTSSGTYIGLLELADIESVSAMNSFFESWWHEYHAEESFGGLDNSTASYTADSRSLVNKITSRSWIYACASAALNTDSSESIVPACDSPSN